MLVKQFFLPDLVDVPNLHWQILLLNSHTYASASSGIPKEPTATRKTQWLLRWAGV